MGQTVDSLYNNLYTESLRQINQAKLNAPGPPTVVMNIDGQPIPVTADEAARIMTARAADLNSRVNEAKSPAEISKLRRETDKLTAEVAQMPAELQNDQIRTLAAALQARVAQSELTIKQQNADTALKGVEVEESEINRRIAQDKTTQDNTLYQRKMDLFNAKGDAIQDKDNQKAVVVYNESLPDEAVEVIYPDTKGVFGKGKANRAMPLPVIDGYQLTMKDIKALANGKNVAGLRGSKAFTEQQIIDQIYERYQSLEQK